MLPTGSRATGRACGMLRPHISSATWRERQPGVTDLYAHYALQRYSCPPGIAGSPQRPCADGVSLGAAATGQGSGVSGQPPGHLPHHDLPRENRHRGRGLAPCPSTSSTRQSSVRPCSPGFQPSWQRITSRQPANTASAARRRSARSGTTPSAAPSSSRTSSASHP